MSWKMNHDMPLTLCFVTCRPWSSAGLVAVHACRDYRIIALITRDQKDISVLLRD